MEEFSEVLLDVQKEYKRSNKLKVCICIAQAIPTVTSAETVAITIGTGTATIHGNTKKQTYTRKHCRRSVYKT